MALPLPRRRSDLLGPSSSLSLSFDHGYAGYDERADWAHTKADPKHGVVEGRTAFLRAFVSQFNDSDQYGPFLDRREAALKQQTARSVDAASSSPLLVGLGRWNPTGVGFNLDRFTGCPFIPGSSVKGLLREAARLVTSKELPALSETAIEYWKTNLSRIFGRGPGEKTGAAREEHAGSVRFFDAFPISWPSLELDVMTPHYGEYYGDPTAVAADWEDPVPVHFLRVPAKTVIRFWLAACPKEANSADLDNLAELLTIALDWLGVGAKTSSGYGWFESTGGSANAAGASANKADKPKEQRLEWPGVVLQYERGTGTLYAIFGAQKAYAKARDLEAIVPAELLAHIKDKTRKQQLTATVIVEEMGNDRKIVQVLAEGGS
jgi:CRISPR-associated protein Cmr6